MPTLKQLRYFDAVARLGHFGRAADLCSVTQPALSMQIKELETELGVRLLERLHDGARLTAAGNEIADRAAGVLAAMQDLVQTARQSRGPLSGPLRFGVIPSVAPYLLPGLLPLLRRDFPDLSLQIRETQTAPLLQELKDGRLDLLLLALPIEEKGVQTLHLFDDPFMLAVPAATPDPQQPDTPAELLRDEPLLLLEEGHCFRDQALAFCQLRNIGQTDTFGASTLATVIQMVANGMGVTFLPEMAVPVESHTENIRLLAMDAPAPSREIGLAWRRSAPGAVGYELLGHTIREAHTVLKTSLPVAAA
jgi:LysR family transcriptional regulator, hydrogen peroxide-inducible genes activator